MTYQLCVLAPDGVIGERISVMLRERWLMVQSKLMRHAHMLAPLTACTTFHDCE